MVDTFKIATMVVSALALMVTPVFLIIRYRKSKGLLYGILVGLASFFVHNALTNILMTVLNAVVTLQSLNVIVLLVLESLMNAVSLVLAIIFICKAFPKYDENPDTPVFNALGHVIFSFIQMASIMFNFIVASFAINNGTLLEIVDANAAKTITEELTKASPFFFLNQSFSYLVYFIAMIFIFKLVRKADKKDIKQILTIMGMVFIYHIFRYALLIGLLPEVVGFAIHFVVVGLFLGMIIKKKA